MKNELEKSGFSLTEVLLAVGTLAIGMIFVAGVFPVGIHFSTIATEQTIAAVAADEAFAKIRLYGINLADANLAVNQLTPFEEVALRPIIDPNEFAYPSTYRNITEKHYFWSALCRRVGLSDVQVTVFVSRKIGAGTTYQGGANWPVPLLVGVSIVPEPGNENKLTIEPNKESWINDGYTIVDNETGQIYRVPERYKDDPSTPEDEEQIILLNRPWQIGAAASPSVWVVPPPVGSGRYPCIAVYQKQIPF